jgi:hypothetical protein
LFLTFFFLQVEKKTKKKQKKKEKQKKKKLNCRMSGDDNTVNPQTKFLMEALRAELGKLITTEMEAVHERINALEERPQHREAHEAIRRASQ